MQAMTTEQSEGPRTGNVHDSDYDALLGRLQARFLKNIDGGKAPLFTTDLDLWDAYIDSFPTASRQYHNCSSCRHFIRRFGSLLTIDETGATKPAMWDPEDANSEHAAGIVAMCTALKRAKVTGVFLSAEPMWGDPVTGIWTHFAVTPPASIRYRGLTLTANQAMAEKREDHKNVLRALEEFTAPMLTQALTLLNSEALYRSEKVLGPAQWLSDLHTNAQGRHRSNVVWRAIASAPAGFCHPRSSMIGTLLEDIASGMPFETVARRFKDKMHPLQYQRPQAAPSAGTIAQAEKVIGALKAAGSLERRFARLDEIVALWKPTTEPESTKEGVFGHLIPKGEKAPAPMTVSAQTITWEKFARTVLPLAKAIEAFVPHRGNFMALLTAQNPDAPPILQWDSEERRNPVSWYLYHGGSDAVRWRLAGSTWARVTAITLKPSMWFGSFEHQGKEAVLIISGAVDTFEHAGNALFPETLKSELHGIRSVIEAYSRGAKIHGREEGSACGLGVVGSNVRVTNQDGTRLEYRIDRWD